MLVIEVPVEKVNDGFINKFSSMAYLILVKNNSETGAITRKPKS